MKIHCLMLVSLIVLSACKIHKEEKLNMSTKVEAGLVHCVGRNFITLPSSFVASSVTTGIFKPGETGLEDPSIDVVVRNNAFSSGRFQAEVQKRRVELKSADDGNVNVLRLDKKLSDGANLFRVQEIDDAYVSEISALRGSSIVTLRLESYHGKYIEAEEILIKLINGINAIDASEALKPGPRFCLGAVNIAGNFSLESGSFLFRDGKGANYEVERMSGPDSLLKLFDVKHQVLRARERTAAGMRAQEWLGWAKINDEPDAKTLKFALDTMRAKSSRAAPKISLTFETAQPLEDGAATKTLISDDEAIQQWDAVVDSIRPVGV
jgi:hypothetical protein